MTLLDDLSTSELRQRLERRGIAAHVALEAALRRDDRRWRRLLLDWLDL